mgnify:CR=1 FL=1
MNYIKHLTGFFDKIVQDFDLNPTHISLYLALFQFWNLNRFQNPISITRDEVMRISKISSYATYHKCMRELHQKGYLVYEPSYNPFKGSLVHMINLSSELKPLKKSERTNAKSEQENKQALNRKQTSNDTSTEQALVSSINNINSTNSFKNINKDEQAKIKKTNKTNNQTSECKIANEEITKKKLREKKSCTEPSRSSTVAIGKVPPTQEAVWNFFEEKQATQLEAEKFFNYFESNGWLVGGKTKMKDWKAAARNWLLNSQNFNAKAKGHQEYTKEPKPNHLHTSNQKNYGEPL